MDKHEYEHFNHDRTSVQVIIGLQLNRQRVGDDVRNG